MKNKNIYIFLLMFLVCILSISAISATENTSKEVTNTDNKEYSLETTTNQYNDVSNSNDNVELKKEENVNDNRQGKSGTDKTTAENDDPLSFRDLNTTINGNTNSTIYLSHNYKYNSATDSGFTSGIMISRNLTVYGNGVTLDGNNMARIFYLVSSPHVNFYNINFINGQTTSDGGAIYGGNAYNCNFTGNNASYGGAIRGGNAYNCTFTGNKAKYDGGAIAWGNAYNCTFTGNKAGSNGGAISTGNAYNCTFTENNASQYGGAIYRGHAYNCTFTGNKAGSNGGAIREGNAYNCTFTGNNASQYGGAIYRGDAYNCTFTGNNATTSGGAIREGNAYNCTFTGNNATSGGAINQGNAYNCTFTGNNATSGGAISWGNAYNCTFTGNNASEYGGAIYLGDAYNCTFTGNKAKYGGAMFYGTAIFCTFNGDTTNETTIIPAVINVINYTSPYMSGERLKFNLTANGTLYDGFNTTIKIYKDGALVKTVYGLTGEGWIVDLKPGNYTAVLSLTDYPEEKSTNATIIVKENAFVVISPISDVVVGKEVIINYTTNSNGTVTILVNGTPINDVKFTPTQAGTYNVTIQVAENDYYTAAYNETTFIAVKTNTTVEIKPIVDVVVGKEVIINYTTNSNGTVIIKVNGEVISDGNFTPTKTGIYNLTVEIAENDYYTAGFNQTTFTVGKLESQIITSPVTTTYNVGKNLVITLKDSNGKAIKGAALTVNLGGSKKYRTDDNGQIKINIAKLTPKTYNAKITYTGSDNYNSSTKTVKVTVKKATPKITAKSASYKLKIKTKKYTVNLKDNENKALKSRKVSLKVNGKNYITKTNSKGQAIFKITNLKKKGRYTAVITIPTNKYYNKLSKKVKITVKQ